MRTPKLSHGRVCYAWSRSAAAVVLLLVAGVVPAAPKRERAPTALKPPAETLKAVRAGFETTIVPNSFQPIGPAPEAPAKLYRRVRYPSPAGKLVAYVTPDPKDGKRRPAVVWAHGGFGGLSEAYWQKHPASNDQTPKAFLDAGFVVMLPAWRGENDNPGRFELFYGEVDDAVAAVDYVAKLPYVDPNRVYMVGHSTGGTITLLAALSTDKLRAAFSFGGAPDVGRVVSDGEGYGNTPFDPANKQESRLRSAIHFVESLKTPTWYLEGEASSYVDEAREMQRRAARAGAPFKAHILKGGDHFNILRPLTALIAREIVADKGPVCTIDLTEAEVTAAFAKTIEERRKRVARLPLVTLTPAAAREINAIIADQRMDPKKVYLDVRPREA